MRIIAATQNKGKLKEYEEIVKKFGFELVSQSDAGFGNVDIDECGATLEENSLIKADTICRASGEITLADDSGLMIDALGGEPGVLSARYAGEHGNEAANRAKVLRLMEGIPPEKRTATFATVITIAFPDGSHAAARGECPGRISEAELGDRGFGYDSVFIPDGFDRTFAQMDVEIKNRIGHRAKAVEKLADILKKF